MWLSRISIESDASYVDLVMCYKNKERKYQSKEIEYPIEQTDRLTGTWKNLEMTVMPVKRNYASKLAEKFWKCPEKAGNFSSAKLDSHLSTKFYI